MPNLTTQQTIKVKVNQLDGSLVPQNKQPVVLKNTVQESIGLSGLGNVNEGTPMQGGTLVYNSSTNLYDVRELTLRDIGDITGTPANNDIIFYNANTDSFYYGSVVTTLSALSDVNLTGRANGTVLTYNSATNTYVHAAALTANGAATLGSVSIGNAQIVITSISSFANTTQLGSNSSGSTTELVTAKAVKDYVDTVVAASGGGGGGGASNLNGLLDVYIDGGGLINRQVLLFDGGRNEWVNRDIHGVANNIWMTTNANNDIVIALANDVVIANTLTVPTANVVSLRANTLVTNSTASIGNNATVAGTLGVGQDLAVARIATFSNNVIVHGGMTVNSSSAFNGNVTVNAISTFANTVTIQANTSVQRLEVDGALITSGPVTIGNTSTTLSINARIATDIIPEGNNLVSLGSPTRRFKDLYVSGNTLYVGTVQLSGATGDFVVNSAMQVVGNTVFNSNVIISDRLSVDGASILNGNVTLGTDSTNIIDVKGVLTGNVIPSANDSYTIGNTSNRFSYLYAHNVVAVTGQYSGDVTISGNLVVQGSRTEISVDTMQVEDPLIKLSANNTADIVDIGFYGVYNDGTERYTGLARDASDGSYFLFANLVAQPTTTVLVTSPSFQLATLRSYVSGGGLVTSPTSITITANTTQSLTISANTLALSTALGSQYGGTGRSNLTNNAVIVGNGFNSVQQISGTNSQMLSIVGGVPTFVSSIDAGEY